MSHDHHAPATGHAAFPYFDDHHAFWVNFLKLATRVSIAIAVLLVFMAIFVA